MTKTTNTKISPKINLFSAVLVHASVEIPFFIFPVVVLLVGDDIFQNFEFGWIGLGVLGTVGTLAVGLPSPFFGTLSDKYRRGSMMALSLVLGSLGALIIGLAGNSIATMLLGIVLLGLGVSLYHPPGLSWVSIGLDDPAKRGSSPNLNRILAIHGIGGTIGAAIGPLSVYFLIDTISWREIYLMWSIPLAAIALGFWILVGRHESNSNSSFSSKRANVAPHPDASEKTLNSNNTTVLIIFSFMLAMSLTRGMITFILSPFLIEEKAFQTGQAAFYVGFSTLLGSIGQLVGGYLGDKYSERIVLSFSAALQVVVLAGIYIADVQSILFIFYILLGMATAIFWPATNSLVAKSATHRGKAFGWFMLIANVIGALGPVIDGILLSIDPDSYLLIFCLAGFSAICAFICMLFLRKTEKRIAAVPYYESILPE
ncbi:MAG: MFS transporter [Candidatus Heimdallarchaeota archaeon]